MTAVSASGSSNSGAAASAAPASRHPWRAVISASIGNALEWFDLVVYGFFAVTISALFFPNHDENTSLLLTLGTFGVSFFMRPLGAVVIGVYADRKGRRAALTLSILLMMVGTLIIALLPTYAAIGVMAPIGIVAARMIQGFSAGGEFGSATAFLAEHAPSRRGFYSSFQVASQGLTTLLAAGFGAVLTTTLTPDQMQSWGWRVPFLFGLLIGPVAYYIRRHVDETPEFLQAETTETPLRDTLSHQKERLLLAMGVVIVATVSTYLVLYMPTYAVKQLGLPPSAAFAATLATGVVQMLFAPLVGHWSDRYGRTPAHAPRRAAVAGVDLAAVLAAQPLSRLRRDAGGAGGAGTDDDAVLRRAAGAGVGDLPRQDTHHGPLALVQHRGDAVRRVRALHPDLADRCHRQQAGAELLPDGLRGDQSGGAGPDAHAPGHPLAAHALVSASCSITKK